MSLKTQTEQRMTRYNNNSPREPSVTRTHSSSLNSETAAGIEELWVVVDLSCLVMLLVLATCMARSPPVYLWFLNQSRLNISFVAYQKSFFTAFCQLILFFTGIILCFFFLWLIHVDWRNLIFFFRATKINNLMASYPTLWINMS